jgi:diphthamide synthase subunit DPH2
MINYKHRAKLRKKYEIIAICTTAEFQERLDKVVSKLESLGIPWNPVRSRRRKDYEVNGNRFSNNANQELKTMIFV